MNRWDRLRAAGERLPIRQAAMWDSAVDAGHRHQRAHMTGWHAVGRVIHRSLMDGGWAYGRALAWSKLALT